MTSVPINLFELESNLIIEKTGGQLSIDGGLPLVDKFITDSNFKSFVHDAFGPDSRKHVTHRKEQVVLETIEKLICGYRDDKASTQLKNNALFTHVLNKTAASQPTISRFYNQARYGDLLKLLTVNQNYLDQYYTRENKQTLIIDVDSTHFDTFGRQELSNYNHHYGTYGFHPLVAFDGKTGLFLSAQLRSGNRYTSTGVVEFLQPILHHFVHDLGYTSILVRGDSGFAVPDLYELCESYGVRYVIRLKLNAKLKQIGAELQVYNPNVDFDKSEAQYSTFDYQAGTWSKSRHVVTLQERRASELIFDSTYVVTNLDIETITPEDIIRIYRKRGNMENYIKEAKLGFFMDKTDSSSFMANTIRMMLSMMAYNIFKMMALLVLPESMKNYTIATFRERFIKVAGKLVSHARRFRLKLDETFVYLEEYFRIGQRIVAFNF